MIRTVGAFVDRERALQLVDRSWNYVLNESNPLVQGFYMVILLGCYVVFVRDAYPLIPNAYAAGCASSFSEDTPV